MTAKEKFLNCEQYLNDCAEELYKEGQYDCMIFIAGWVDVLSGTSYAEELRGSYKSLLEGKRLHAPEGFYEPVVERIHPVGWRKRYTLYHGDLVWMDNANWAIYMNGYLWGALLGMRGIARIDKAHAKEIWRKI